VKQDGGGRAACVALMVKVSVWMRRRGDVSVMRERSMRVLTPIGAR